MSRTRIVGGKIYKHSLGAHHMYAEENIVFNSNKFISETGEENGVTYGEPKDPPKIEIEEGEYKLESTYVHDHLKNVAIEITTKNDNDKESIVYKFYKEIADGKIVNPEIIVSKYRFSNKLAYYDNRNEKIIVWQDSLIEIDKENDKKILLILALTEAYGDFINFALKDKLNPDTNLETYEYDLFRFDGIGDKMVTIGKMESPNYSGNLDLNFPKEKNTKVRHKTQDKKERGGPRPGDFDDYSEEEINAGNLGGPGDPIPNIAFVFKYSLGGGFSVSICAGIQKNIGLGKDWGITPSINMALTYYGNGTPGTSPLSRELVNLSLSPALTMGYKTGNSLPLNLFNQYTATGVNNSYEYSFTMGTTGVLSSGEVTSNYEVDEFGNDKLDLKGNKIRIKDPYNSHDHKNRHQIIGGTAIKVGNFMISSYNDVFKPPLFLGYNSDQYWSAGVFAQATAGDRIRMAYAFDLYYGKSNNKNPFNLDKMIGGQNYDNQKFFDLLLNRGQESFTYIDAAGNFHVTNKFGYGTFWGSNKTHDGIKFPEKPKEPEIPIKERFSKIENYEKAKQDYDKDLAKYEIDYKNYITTMILNPNATFHHLMVVYKAGSIHPDLERIQTYTDALPPKLKVSDFHVKTREELIKEINEIERKVQDDIKSKK